MDPRVEAVVLALFVFTQAVYFVANATAFALLYVRGTNVVREAEDVEPRQIQVLMPVVGERRAVLEETMAELFAADYPSEYVQVHLVYEEDDELVTGYLEEFAETAADRGWRVSTVAVNRRVLSTHLSQNFDTAVAPRTKAAALTYAFVTRSFDASDVITVFDSDTQMPADLFTLAVSGLETYDIVQAKQTVRNHAEGWLPRLEAMGIAAWCDLVYEHSSRGPYQLLGKGYFLEARTVNALEEWEADAVTEDMALGLTASLSGQELGVVDRYVQDLCPPRYRDWVRQKRRWVRGPYEYLGHRSLTGLARVRFWSVTVLNQVVALNNLVGLPVGVLLVVWVVLGTPLAIPTAAYPLLAVNLLGWVYYSVRSIRATEAAVRFDSTAQRLLFYVQSNPVTQALYATLWSVPIVLAVVDYVRGKPAEFEVTPK
jgi:cellulose synthase/poly-beta-1,6-N-acetylglucosamine synthase-like glycosyltransferase